MPFELRDFQDSATAAAGTPRLAGGIASAPPDPGTPDPAPPSTGAGRGGGSLTERQVQLTVRVEQLTETVAQLAEGQRRLTERQAQLTEVVARLADGQERLIQMGEVRGWALEQRYHTQAPAYFERFLRRVQRRRRKVR